MIETRHGLPSLDPGFDLESIRYPRFRELIPDQDLSSGRYRLRFARDAADLDSVLRLRYAVFNLELGEGLDSSHVLGRDLDDYDAQCHHLMVIEAASEQVIGTYRMQLSQMAETGQGYYSDGLFDIAAMPDSVLRQAVETGRACIAPAHRSGRVLFLLWRGIAHYMQHTGQRYLFGCSSLTSQDPAQGLAAWRALERRGLIHPEIRIQPRAGHRCHTAEPASRPKSESTGLTLDADLEQTGQAQEKTELPHLLQLYLRYGAKICGGPALDRDFKTIDFLTLLDLRDFEPRTLAKLLAS